MFSILFSLKISAQQNTTVFNLQLGFKKWIETIYLHRHQEREKKKSTEYFFSPQISSLSTDHVKSIWLLNHFVVIAQRVEFCNDRSCQLCNYSVLLRTLQRPFPLIFHVHLLRTTEAFLPKTNGTPCSVPCGKSTHWRRLEVFSYCLASAESTSASVELVFFLRMRVTVVAQQLLCFILGASTAVRPRSRS